VGGDEQLFTSLVIGGGSIPSSFLFTGTPFCYDPSQGNLLLAIDKPDSNDTFSGFTDNSAGFNGVSRVWSGDLSGFGSIDTSYGPVIRIHFDQKGARTVPEPGTLALAGLGVLALVGYKSWKSRRSAPSAN
jgi:hypothetical protein